MTGDYKQVARALWAPRMTLDPVKILALDTSTDQLSVAVLVDTECRDARALAPRRHAELLLPLIERVLDEAGLRLLDLDAIAFGCGPGTFTGVRLAVSVAQGLGLGAARPLAPISSLAALARGAWRRHGEPRILAALDARMGGTYLGAYACVEGSLATVLADQLCDADAPPIPSDHDWFGAGTAFPAAATPFARGLGPRWRGADASLVPDAVDIAWLARPMVQAGSVLDPANALPYYGRDQVATPRRDRS